MTRNIRLEDAATPDGGLEPSPGAHSEPVATTTAPRLTKEQAAIIGAYTGIVCGPFMDVHEYAEKVLGTSIGSSAFGMLMLAEQLKEAAKADFLAICHGDD